MLLSEKIERYIAKLNCKRLDDFIEENEQLKAEKEELQKVLISFVKCSCYACPDGVENPNEEECRGCGYYDCIKLLEKQMGKSWEEIKDMK
ncbi:MAG TPA: hypothetical protein VGB37_12055 [Candidatus Lokiarchaeia archaeon]